MKTSSLRTAFRALLAVVFTASAAASGAKAPPSGKIPLDSMRELAVDSSQRIYRLTLDPAWGDTFRFRIENSGAGGTLVMERFSGSVNKQGERLNEKETLLTPAQFAAFELLVQESQFSDMPRRDDSMGLDGDSWRMEFARAGFCQEVVRWCPDLYDAEKGGRAEFAACFRWAAAAAGVTDQITNKGARVFDRVPEDEAGAQAVSRKAHLDVLRKCRSITSGLVGEGAEPSQLALAFRQALFAPDAPQKFATLHEEAQTDAARAWARLGLWVHDRPAWIKLKAAGGTWQTRAQMACIRRQWTVAELDRRTESGELLKAVLAGPALRPTKRRANFVPAGAPLTAQPDLHRRTDPALSLLEQRMITAALDHLETSAGMRCDAYFRITKRAAGYEIYVIRVTGYRKNEPQFESGGHTILLDGEGKVANVTGGK